MTQRIQVFALLLVVPALLVGCVSREPVADSVEQKTAMPLQRRLVSFEYTKQERQDGSKRVQFKMSPAESRAETLEYSDAFEKGNRQVKARGTLSYSRLRGLPWLRGLLPGK